MNIDLVSRILLNQYCNIKFENTLCVNIIYWQVYSLMDNSFGKYDTKQMIWTNVRFGQLLIRFKKENVWHKWFFFWKLFSPDTIFLFFFCAFRIGNDRFKSKVIYETLCPRWLEQFDLNLSEDQVQELEVTVWDKDQGRKDDFMGR